MKQEVVKSYHQAQEFIRNIESDIQQININSPSQIIHEILSKITSRVLTDHMGVIITLHTRNFLDKLLTLCSTSLQRDKYKEGQSNIQTIYNIGYKCFFQFEPKYLKIFDSLKIKPKQSEDKKSKSLTSEDQNKRYQKIQNILIQLYKLKPMDRLYGTGVQLNELIQKLSTLPFIKTPLQQILYTWVRRQIEIIQSEVWKQKSKQFKVNLICCYLHFQFGSRQEFVQNIYQTALNNYDLDYERDINNTLKKLVVSFLNSEGGIIYLGFKYDQANKIIETSGYPLFNQDKLKFLEFVIKHIAFKIYPSDIQDINQTVQSQNTRLLKLQDQKFTRLRQQINNSPQKNSFNLTKYVSVEFVNIYNQDSLLYQRRNQDINRIYYIIKINVKTGDPFQVYHFINQKQVPEAYFRQGINLNKKNIFQYYDMLYDKLKQKANRQQPLKKPKTAHYLCRNTLHPKANQQNQQQKYLTQ